jgi:hypothetical protein
LFGWNTQIRFQLFCILGDTPRVAAGIFKQNFKVKCESRKTKKITWRYSSRKKNIIYESMLILLRERAILKSLILHVFQLREFYDVLLAKYNMLLVIEIDEDINIWCGEF